MQELSVSINAEQLRKICSLKGFGDGDAEMHCFFGSIILLMS